MAVRVNRLVVVTLGALVPVAAGCQQKTTGVVTPDYGRALGPGESALRKITDPARMPDLASAFDRFQSYDQFLFDSLDNSERWFHAPSSRQFFPIQADADSVTHDKAAASVAAFREALEESHSAAEFAERVESTFDVYESVGWNGEGVVLYTGYYAPVFPASRQPSAEYPVPLYRRPADLVTDPVTGAPQGRRTATGDVVPYATRAEINQSNMFDGNELVWVKDELAAYIIHVNGSAKLRMPDGTTMHIGYAGKTDRPYYGLGQSMLDEGILTKNNLTLTAIKNEFRKDPARVIQLMNRNENYVFFTEYDASRWPSGSLGVPVTEQASLATDKKIFPRGGVVLVDTQAVTLSYDKKPFLQFMLDQDTGGAIQAPGRADIYMGSGETAEVLAGGQYAEGRLFYFFLKDELVAGAATATAE